MVSSIQFGKPLSLNIIACLALLAQHKTRKEMAHILGISQTTIYSRFRSMHEQIYVFTALDWDEQMRQWTIQNQKKILNYVEAMKVRKDAKSYVTMRTLWLAAGLELIE